FTTDAFWAWHTGNAFERDGEIVIDLVRHADFRDTAGWLEGVVRGVPGGAADGVLHRVRIDPARKTLTSERMRERTGEFPRVAPAVEGRSHRFLYCGEHSSPEIARGRVPDTLVRVDVETGAHDEHRFAAHESPSEGVFVSRPGARD